MIATAKFDRDDAYYKLSYLAWLKYRSKRRRYAPYLWGSMVLLGVALLLFPTLHLVAFAIIVGGIATWIDTATYFWRWRRRIKRLGFSEWVKLGFAEEGVEFRSPLGEEMIGYDRFVDCIGTPLGIFLRMTPDSSLFVPMNSIEPPEHVEKLLAHLQRKVPATS
jgi:hypothetical protein